MARRSGPSAQAGPGSDRGANLLESRVHFGARILLLFLFDT